MPPTDAQRALARLISRARKSWYRRRTASGKASWAAGAEESKLATDRAYRSLDCPPRPAIATHPEADTRCCMRRLRTLRRSRALVCSPARAWAIASLELPYQRATPSSQPLASIRAPMTPARSKGRRRLEANAAPPRIDVCSLTAHDPLAQRISWRPNDEAQLAKGLSKTAATIRALRRKMLRVAFAVYKQPPGHSIHYLSASRCLTADHRISGASTGARPRPTQRPDPNQKSNVRAPSRPFRP